MNQEPKRRFDARWGRHELAALLCGCIIGGAALAFAMPGRCWLGEYLPFDAARAAIAAEKINPNDAPAWSMERLPGIGPARAAEIVHYRQQHPPQPFARAADLEKVRGLGPAAVQRLQDHLQFGQRE